MPGGSGKGIALTAYVLTVFLENKDIETTYDKTINRAIDYISKSLESQLDIYALAVCSYALQLAEHPNREAILDQLLLKSTTKGAVHTLIRNRKFKSQKTITLEIVVFNSIGFDFCFYFLRSNSFQTKQNGGPDTMCHRKLAWQSRRKH